MSIRTHHQKAVAVLGVLFVSLAASRAVLAQRLVYSGALQCATGDYVYADRTNSAFLLNGLTLYAGSARLYAGLPVIYQNTSVLSQSGPGMIPTGEMGESGMNGGMHGGDMHSSGALHDHQLALGDPLLRADVDVVKTRPGLSALSLTGLVKAPVADPDRGLGTGEWDYGVGLSIAHSIRRNALFASAVYWIMGDPTGVDFENPVVYSVSLGRPFSGGKVSALLTFSGNTQVMADLDPLRQLGIAVSYWATPVRYINGSMFFGLSESAPDVGISIGWGITL